MLRIRFLAAGQVSVHVDSSNEGHCRFTLVLASRLGEDKSNGNVRGNSLKMSLVIHSVNADERALNQKTYQHKGFCT